MSSANASHSSPGGQAGMRGYLVQTLIALLDSLADGHAFVRVTLEPDHESEKIDILWEYAESRRTVQVKSSVNQFTKSDVEKWAGDLREQNPNADSELCLVGLFHPALARLNEVADVKLVKLNNDPVAFREQVAHRLDRFLRAQNLPSGTGEYREMLADALTARLATYSTTGSPLMPVDLVRLLRTWVGPVSESPPQTPTVTQPYASLSIGVPNGPNARTCNGQFLASNKGSSSCNIEDVRLFTEGIALPEYNLVAVGHQPGHGVNEPGTRKLPLPVPVNQPIWVYFRTKETEELYRGELPETVILKVFFDCVNEPLCKTLKRAPGDNQYREE